MTRLVVIGLIVTFLVSGCNTEPAPQPVDQPTIPENSTAEVQATAEPTLPEVTYQGVGLDTLDQFAAIFVVSMQTEKPWSYQLNMRRSGDLQEFELHMEGVDPARNPGDIRLVTDGKISRMLGEGTDNLCLQFPADMQGSPQFLLPDDLIIPVELATQLVTTSIEDQPVGQVLHQTAASADLTGWKDVQAEVWTSIPEGRVDQVTMTAQGDDVLFGTGQGALDAEYKLESTDPQQIEPVTGCEVSLPLTEDAARMIILPGMISFETTMPMDEIVAFYKAALEEQGWLAYDLTKSSQNTSVMSYRRGEESLEVTVEVQNSGCKVQLSTF